MNSTASIDVLVAPAGTFTSEQPGPVGVLSVGELFGGVERHILGLLGALERRGIATTLFVFHDDELARQARLQHAEVVLLPAANRSLLSTSQELARQLRDRGIGILHVHGYKATVCAALVRWKHRIAIVKTEHGLPEIVSGQGLQVKARLYHWLDTFATRSSVGAVCYVTADLMAKLPRLPQRVQTQVISNGVETVVRATLTRPPEFTPNSFNVPVIGRLEPVKGHAYAIEALAKPTMPGNVQLHVIGSGPQEGALRELAKTHGVADRVHFLGFRTNVFDYVAYCDALLIPSLHEGLPYTLLEAMALATPIVCTRVGGLAEVLHDGRTALLVPPADATALAAAVQRLHADPELRLGLGQAARRVQQSSYSLDRMADAYLAIYRRVLPGAARSSVRKTISGHDRRPG